MRSITGAFVTTLVILLGSSTCLAQLTCDQAITYHEYALQVSNFQQLIAERKLCTDVRLDPTIGPSPAYSTLRQDERQCYIPIKDYRSVGS